MAGVTMNAVAAVPAIKSGDGRDILVMNVSWMPILQQRQGNRTVVEGCGEAFTSHEVVLSILRQQKYLFLLSVVPWKRMNFQRTQR